MIPYPWHGVMVDAPLRPRAETEVTWREFDYLNPCHFDDDVCDVAFSCLPVTNTTMLSGLFDKLSVHIRS